MAGHSYSGILLACCSENVVFQKYYYGNIRPLFGNIGEKASQIFGV
ncbi:hypothetical protein NY78_3266 [Desulfovibrio sp. TomC]|nr:hypothetical protein NY78_3266 [Desulfovibrio sp. TomC]